jgi:hypothetical protein
MTGRVRLARVVGLVGFAASAALAPPSAATASSGFAAQAGVIHAVIVQGASGEPQYAKQHRAWVDGLARVLRERMRIDPSRITILAEQPAAGEQRGTADSVRAVLGRLATATRPADLVFITLIGHGSSDGSGAKFNLVGPDLTAAEWGELLKPIPARLAIANTTSTSFPFLAGLSGPNRVIVTATSNASQRYHTIFPDALIRALEADDADADKNGRVSVLEAFTYAARLVALHYEQAGRMATETPMLDDNGDGKGILPGAAGDDGLVAGVTYLGAAVTATSSDPQVQKLIARQQELTEQIDDLRRRRASMTPEDFDREFEKLIIDLALVSRDVRRQVRKF